MQDAIARRLFAGVDLTGPMHSSRSCDKLFGLSGGSSFLDTFREPTCSTISIQFVFHVS